jgi:hypothetical protein
MLSLFLWWAFLSVTAAILIGTFLERGSRRRSH